MINGDASKNEKIVPSQLIEEILNVYDEYIHISAIDIKNNITVTSAMDEVK